MPGDRKCRFCACTVYMYECCHTPPLKNLIVHVSVLSDSEESNSSMVIRAPDPLRAIRQDDTGLFKIDKMTLGHFKIDNSTWKSMDK